MPSPLEPKQIRNLGTYGVIRQNSVDDALIPDGAATEVQNFHFDRVGAATLRPGLTLLGATVLTSRPNVGLFNAQSGTAIAAFSNGSSATIYSFSSGAWGVSLDGGTASVAIRFLDFASYTIAINFMYNTYTSMRFWNAGSSRHWHHTGNPINPQHMWGRANQFGEVYKSKVYLAGDTSREGNGSRLYFSSVISTAGIITWSPTLDFVDMNPGDGETITGLKRFSKELCVFKPNYVYRFTTSGADPDPLIKIGTRSNESIVEGKRGLYFHHDSGFYRYSGEYPVEISRPINDFVEAIPFSQCGSITSWNDADHIYWSIGNLTVAETDGNYVWKNVVLRFTESSDLWTIYSYAQDIRRGVAYNNGSTLTRIVGNDMGVVATFNSGNTDLGEPIKYKIRTKWFEWDGIFTSKVISTIVVLAEKSQAAEFMYQADDDTAWHSLGQMKKLLNYFYNTDVRFHRIRFQVVGSSRFEPMIFKGIEIVQGINEGIIE